MAYFLWTAVANFLDNVVEEGAPALTGAFLLRFPILYIFCIVHSFDFIPFFRPHSSSFTKVLLHTLSKAFGDSLLYHRVSDGRAF